MCLKCAACMCVHMRAGRTGTMLAEAASQAVTMALYVLPLGLAAKLL